MRLLIAGGGTGGHLFPGIAVAQELLGRAAEHRVLFAGTDRGLEARVLPPLGLPFTPVRAAGLVGTGLRGTLRSLGLLALGLADATRILRRFRPQTCLGVGGYVSFPVVALARLAGVPSAIQEQNARPGLTNRLLARFVQRVYAGDPGATTAFPVSKTKVTGNPLRAGLCVARPYEPPPTGGPPRILVIGGSQGARILNEVLPEVVDRVSVPLEVLHQAGRGRDGAVRSAYGDRRGVRVVEFIEDMGSAYDWCHLVIARSGALTVAEAASAGRPAVFVPLASAAGGHQEANARAAEERGSSVCVTEDRLDPGQLARLLEELLESPERLETMARAASGSARRDAARDIVDDLLRLSRG